MPDPAPSAPSPEVVTALAARLTRLEAAKRRSDRIAAFAAAGLLLVPLLAFHTQDQGKPAPGKLSATSLAIVDSRGEERLVLGLDEKNQPRIEMRDAAQKPRFVTQMRNDEVLMMLKDGAGETRLGLAVDSGKHPHVTMTDGEKRLRLHATINHEGAPSVLLRRADGSIGAGLGVHADGRPWQVPAPDSRPSSGR